MTSPLFYYSCFNSNFILMATTAKGAPRAKQTRGTNKIAKTQGTPMPKRPTPNHYEYELLRPNGAIYLMRNVSYNLYDEKSNELKAVRYCEQERSIFKEEQSGNPTKTPISFRNGKLWVDKVKPNLLKFLDNHPQNEANGGSLFRRVDLVAKAQMDVDSELLTADAILLVRNKPVEDLLTVATSYGMNTEREFAEIKHDLLVKAKADPQSFIAAFDDPVVAMKAKVKTAKDYNILKIDGSAVRWYDSNQLIVSVPAGMDGVDVMVRYLLTEKGSPVVEEIDRQLS